MPLTQIRASIQIQEALEAVQNDHIIVVFFTSEWCFRSIAIERMFEQELNLPKLTILKVVTEESLQLAIDYRVTGLPTLLFFQGGQEIVRYAGGNTEAIKRGIKRLQRRQVMVPNRGEATEPAAVEDAAQNEPRGGWFSGILHYITPAEDGWFSGWLGKKQPTKRRHVTAEGEVIQWFETDGWSSAEQKQMNSTASPDGFPRYTIKIHLADGTKLRMCNVKLTARVSAIRDFIITRRPEYRNVRFQLMNSPPTNFLEEAQTVYDANLGNAVVIQHVITRL